MIFLELTLVFALMSVISVGGLPSVMGEIQRVVVDQKAWMGAEDFVQLYAIGQAAPGPNVLIVSLIGWKIAGIPGALVTLVAMCAPAAALSWWVAGLWDRFKDSPWRAVIQRAMAPMVFGLVAAGGVVLATPDGIPDWRLWLIAGLSATGTLLYARLNPLWLLAGGGILGALLL